MRENIGLALYARGVEGKTGCIGADALPVLHLTLVTFLWDLRVKVNRRERMDDERRERRGIGGRLDACELLPVSVGPFAETRENSDPGNPDFSRTASH